MNRLFSWFIEQLPIRYTLGIIHDAHEWQKKSLLYELEKNGKKNSDRVQRAYYLDRDIDKALRRMALEEGKNLTESINDALRKGLVEYL